MKMIMALRRPLSILGFLSAILVAMLSFQNCGQAFYSADNSYSFGPPSAFPPTYQSYGNLPSQAITNYPAATKITVKAAASAGGSGLVITGK